MRACLLYNPHAGRNRHARAAHIEAVSAILRQRGFHITAEPTRAKASAAEQARRAIGRGVEAIFACGGDGTVHDVLQGIAGSHVALGVLPFGSANALARELGFAPDPLRAAAQCSPDRTASLRVGEVRAADGILRSFLTMAGAGPDGLLMYRMLSVDRQRWGRWHYYYEAARLFLRGASPTMQVRWRAADGWHEQDASAVMALRVGDLGGLFSGIARGAGLQDDCLHTILVRGPAWLNFPRWFLSSWLRMGWRNTAVATVKAQELRIEASERTHVQADGEWLGQLPACIRLLDRRLNVFVPGPAH